MNCYNGSYSGKVGELTDEQANQIIESRINNISSNEWISMGTSAIGGNYTPIKNQVKGMIKEICIQGAKEELKDWWVQYRVPVILGGSALTGLAVFGLYKLFIKK